MRRTLLVPITLLVLVLIADPASAKGPLEAVLDGEGMADPVDLRQALGDRAFWEETRRVCGLAARRRELRLGGGRRLGVRAPG